MMDDWRIYLAGGGTFGSTDGVPEDAPATGVVTIVAYYADGSRYQMNKWDFYRWDEASQEWWGQNFWGVVDWFRQTGFVTDVTPGNPSIVHTLDGDFDSLGFIEAVKVKGLVKEGVMVTNEEYSHILGRAHHDFPIRRGAVNGP